MRAVSFLLMILILISLVVAAGCVATPSLADDEFVVAVSIAPEESFVRGVAGDTVSVLVVVPPGYSPETYELTPQQMQRLARADIYLAIGVPAEESILESLNPATVRIDLQDAAKAVYPELAMDGGRDPHVWMSPKRVAVMVDAIVDAFSAYDPASAATYRANGDVYLADLVAVAQEAAAELAPVAGRTFITTHPAFAYFADEYGLKMASLEEDGKEASIQHMQDLVDFAKEKHITVVLNQPEEGTEQAVALAEELGGTVVSVSPLDADYLRMIRNLAATLAGAAK